VRSRCLPLFVSGVFPPSSTYVILLRGFPPLACAMVSSSIKIPLLPPRFLFFLGLSLPPRNPSKYSPHRISFEKSAPFYSLFHFSPLVSGRISFHFPLVFFLRGLHGVNPTFSPPTFPRVLFLMGLCVPSLDLVGREEPIFQTSAFSSPFISPSDWGLENPSGSCIFDPPGSPSPFVNPHISFLFISATRRVT